MAVHAKKKKGAKKHHKRRRMGALALNPSSAIVQYGSIAAGFLLGDKINTAIDKYVDPTKVDGKIVAGVQAGAGAAYMFLKKGKKSLPLQVVSGVLLGSGVKRAMAAFGLGAMPLNVYQQMPHINGYQDLHHVGSAGPRPRLSMGAANPGSNGMGWNTSRIPIGARQPMYTSRRA